MGLNKGWQMSSMDVTTASLRLHALNSAAAYPTDQELAQLRQTVLEAKAYSAWAGKLGWIGSFAVGFLGTAAIWTPMYHGLWCHPV